jgi:hypothetical protein
MDLTGYLGVKSVHDKRFPIKLLQQVKQMALKFGFKKKNNFYFMCCKQV